MLSCRHFVKCAGLAPTPVSSSQVNEVKNVPYFLIAFLFFAGMNMSMDDFYWYKGSAYLYEDHNFKRGRLYVYERKKEYEYFGERFGEPF